MSFILAHYNSLENNLLKLRDIKIEFAGKICISKLKKKDSVRNQQKANLSNWVLTFAKFTVLKILE